MEKVIDKKLCTGCTACMSVCPVQAIQMENDLDGFKYPIINQEKCVNCSMCKKTCPVLNTKNNYSITNCFVGYNKDTKSKLSKASSGSIFELVANYVLDSNGIVIGAAFDEKNKLKHMAVTKAEDLEKLKGSKYLQSDLEYVFKFIKEKLRDNIILFVGTPCQVAGLKAYIKNDFNNLICIDVVCHGVPSPKLFDKFIKEIQDQTGKTVKNYNFRDKRTGWDTYSNTIYFNDNSEKTELQVNNPYMKLFLSDVALRESCYNCKFKLGNKYSDITLGDFWGVQKYYPEMYDKNGVSAIIVNTERGKNIFDKIKGNMYYKKCKLEEIVEGNSSLKISGDYPRKRKKFFNNIDNMSITNLVSKYTFNPNILIKVVKKIKKIIKNR